MLIAFRQEGICAMVIPACHSLPRQTPSARDVPIHHDHSEVVHLPRSSLMSLVTINRGSHRWTLIALPRTTVTPPRCIHLVVDPPRVDIRTFCYISLCPNLLYRMAVTDIPRTPMTLISPLGRSDLPQHRPPPFLAPTPLECPRILLTPRNACLPPVSVILQGLHAPIPQKLLIEIADAMIESGIVNAGVVICKSILPLLPIRCLALEPTPHLIVVTVRDLVQPATTVLLNRLLGTLISQFLAGRILPRGLRVSPQRPVPLLLSPFQSLIPLEGTIRGTTAVTPGS